MYSKLKKIEVATANSYTLKYFIEKEEKVVAAQTKKVCDKEAYAFAYIYYRTLKSRLVYIKLNQL